MPEMTAPQTAPTQADPKTTAANIVNGIQNKAGGKQVPQPAPSDTKGAQGITPPDPNAGKEKFVIEGKEIWLTPEQLRAYAQKGVAFEPKVTQLGHLQHETRAFLQKLSNDPLSVLTDKRIGLTPDAVLDKLLTSGLINEQGVEKIGRWYYENVVVPGKMDPKDRELMEKDKKLAAYEKEKQDQANRIVMAENKKRAEAAGEQLLSFVREAMKNSGLPDIDTTLGTLMARRTLELHKAARGSITPQQAIERVDREISQLLSARLDHLDGEALVKRIGEANAEKIKKHFLKLAKDAQKESPTRSAASIPKRDERKTLSMDEFHDYLDDLKKKG